MSNCMQKLILTFRWVEAEGVCNNEQIENGISIFVVTMLRTYINSVHTASIFIVSHGICEWSRKKTAYRNKIVLVSKLSDVFKMTQELWQYSYWAFSLQLRRSTKPVQNNYIAKLAFLTLATVNLSDTLRRSRNSNKATYGDLVISFISICCKNCLRGTRGGVAIQY